jgi:hypothetical protein
MPRINSVPIKKQINILEKDFTTCFPYHKASSVFAHDSEPFWRYSDFIQAINWLNDHPNSVFHNFGTDSQDDIINLLEISAFLGNFQQECGEVSLEIPYPWSFPKAIKKNEKQEGPAGGALAILEGANAEVILGQSTISGMLNGPKMNLTEYEKSIIQTNETTIQGIVRILTTMNQPQFGLGTGTGNGVVFQENLVGVSDDGTLWGTVNERNTNLGYINPVSEYKLEPTNRKYASLGPSSQYGGRGAIQLSYNYNYTECSLALFGDYRLVKYPNLIITTNRETFNGNSFYFGFPGPNENGNNQLPQFIKDTTPPARILAWLVCFWFWMDPNRSGRKISCHKAMLSPYTIGITTVNAIINNQSGLIEGSWASKKIEYYKRIARILNVPNDNTLQSIVNPPNSLSLLKQ